MRDHAHADKVAVTSNLENVNSRSCLFPLFIQVLLKLQNRSFISCLEMAFQIQIFIRG